MPMQNSQFQPFDQTLVLSFLHSQLFAMGGSSSTIENPTSFVSEKLESEKAVLFSKR